jgi:hypothetical protein
MKSFCEKFLKYSSNIGYHVTSYLAKFELKTQLYAEKNLIWTN